MSVDVPPPDGGFGFLMLFGSSDSIGLCLAFGAGFGLGSLPPDFAFAFILFDVCGSVAWRELNNMG